MTESILNDYRVIYLRSHNNDAPQSKSEDNTIQSNRLLEQLPLGIKETLRMDPTIKEFTSIQLASIPVLIENYTIKKFSNVKDDIIISAPTGQGKTLCYVIPIISSLQDNVHKRMKALILAPTRELLTQILSEFHRFTKIFKMDLNHSTPTVQVVVLNNLMCFPYRNDTNFDDNSFITNISQYEIVITTPQRLNHFINYQNSSILTQVFENLSSDINTKLHDLGYGVWLDSKTRDFNDFRYLEWIVLDEIDLLIRQFSNYTYTYFNKIVSMCHTRPTKIILSATMTHNSEILKKLNLINPIVFVNSIEDECYAIPPNLHQYYIISPDIDNQYTSDQLKPLVLILLLSQIYTSCPSYSGEQHAHLDTVDMCAKRSTKTLIFCENQMVSNITKLLKSHFNNPLYLSERCHKFPPLHPDTSCDNDQELKNRYTQWNRFPSNLHLSIYQFKSSFSTKKREYIINSFNQKGGNYKKIDILVSSDVLSQGVDIHELDFVINYQYPLHNTTYIHRIGRTARQSKEGNVFTIITQNEVNQFMNLASATKVQQNHSRKCESLWDILKPYSTDRDILKNWTSIKCKDSYFNQLKDIQYDNPVIDNENENKNSSKIDSDTDMATSLPNQSYYDMLIEGCLCPAPKKIV